MSYALEPVGVVHSCFREKFGIPRQPGLVPEAAADLEIFPPFDRDEAFRGIGEFSHVWIIFVFHANLRESWKPTVRPPRLGGNRRQGVFATRSGFRPNPIGMSAVALDGVVREKGKLILHLKGVDLMDGTPVLDIKPYLPYADSLPQARGGFAEERPDMDMAVDFAPDAVLACQAADNEHPGFSELLAQLLRCDPRPAYHGSRPGVKEFGMALYDRNVRWTCDNDRICVTHVSMS
ncbi:MAG: tRNA (N6-threonylcarbamoyladenosine(37)-N6)-methyltransferase TrmO [Pseudomonadota bacterium]